MIHSRKWENYFEIPIFSKRERKGDHAEYIKMEGLLEQSPTKLSYRSGYSVLTTAKVRKSPIPYNKN